MKTAIQHFEKFSNKIGSQEMRFKYTMLDILTEMAEVTREDTNINEFRETYLAQKQKAAVFTQLCRLVWRGKGAPSDENFDYVFRSVMPETAELVIGRGNTSDLRGI